MSAGLMHLAWRLALATALQADPSPATAELTCAGFWEPEGDSWWDCYVALETYRCEWQGWCDEPCETAPYTACLSRLPDPARPGQSYVTKRHNPANGY